MPLFLERAINSINTEEILPETADDTDWAGVETKSGPKQTSDDWAVDVKNPRKEEPKKTEKKLLPKIYLLIIMKTIICLQIELVMAKALMR